ncbi:RNA polymerase sigma factor [Streptosporangium roseum]|uniref:RNA polymerase, sigma-24 subunit, ECF subfamily n=1 Tax=Streptosporangium roseum (strain ATCC 12428 / DSM 43021 / JCM 3005 / KCTC 9067 / NCIMB 10171 / NRRL 2505 / NI 9100) TaxID=479432 RepID=D2B8L0_STRRD|nr:RNA polymerase sigma factor [Streptosporangium roseum]ACZ87820.1 RNA polymerase, sigma-24 subunit, ECF subfamily [Streptosporangium roseum DSM 43021]
MAETTTWPDEALIAAARDGDAESIAALVSGAHPHVRHFARHLCATPEEAEDAAQEALIVLCRKIGTLRATGALVPWMFRIIRNECVRQARLALRPPPPLHGAAVRSAEDEMFQRLEAARVAEAIAALPADQRQVLIMRDVQGLGGRTAADALGLTVAATKSRLYRARAAVQDRLGEGARDV